MKKTALAATLIIAVFLMTACAVPASAPASADISVSAQTVSETSLPHESSETNAPAETTPADADETDIPGATIDYILNGQDGLPEAGKLLWSEEFLNLVDIEAVYADYLKNGGNDGDIEGFAVYLTDNAPVPDNWKDLFEADLLTRYEAVPCRYEPLGDDIYQVYVKSDGREVPYVAVNARTGYYHG